MLYPIRLLITAIWVGLSCFIGILAGIIRPFNAKNTTLVCRLISLGRFFMGIEIELRNKEILDLNRPCVFISNHQDNLDIFPGAFSIPPQTVTIGKKSILFIPLFGQFFWLCGNLFIDRKNKKKAYETMDVAAEAIKNKKISIWIMPEGTRSKGRGLLAFKKGAFITAIKANVPVVPIAISSYTLHLNLKKWRSGKIIIEVLPAISTAGLSINEATVIKDQAYEVMRQAIKKIDSEVQEDLKRS